MDRHLNWALDHPAIAPLIAVAALAAIALLFTLIDRHRKDHR